MTVGVPVGVTIGTLTVPEELPRLARVAEECGYSELWMTEDSWFTGAISAAAVALGATRRIPVGLGVAQAMPRHPALLAQECATLARVYPRRFWPGIGLGMPEWLRQMGIFPAAQLDTMREYVTSVRRLLAGDELTLEGRTFSLDRVSLTYPVADPVPIYMGVMSPKMLRLSGEIADGTLGPLLANRAYIRWSREQIELGASDAGRTDGHRLVGTALFSVDPDGRKAKQAVRGAVALYLSAIPAQSMLFKSYGITDILEELRLAGGPDVIDREMPAQWVDDLTVAGDPEECAEQIRGLLEAGDDAVCLFPMPPERTEQVMRLAAAEVLPRLS